MSDLYKTNPFAVKYPEEIEAKEVIDLFVPVFNDFPKVPLPENTFLIGPRGSGKSMMFRYMMPDCQLLEKKSLNELDYFSIYIPIKKTELNKTELKGLTTHANFLINENLLTSHVAILSIDAFRKVVVDDSSNLKEKLTAFFNNEFIRFVKISGHLNTLAELKNDVSTDFIFQSMQKTCEDIYHNCMNYCNISLGFDNENTSYKYSGALTNYLNFLHPLLIKLKNTIFSKETPIFLLFDDADNLNKVQTRILNTWISYRYGPKVSIKVSSEPVSYLTYRTLSGRTIDTPHDYNEVSIDAVYTSSKKKYKENLEKIISKRLEKWQIISDPHLFFPIYEKQEGRIKQIREAYLLKYDSGQGRGSQRNDDAYRYSRPDYIKESFEENLEKIMSARAEYIKLLGGISKQKSKYYYAGFEQLIHLSSGIIRFFLDLASNMYAETQKISGNEIVKEIPPNIQNEMAREFADKFIFNEFERRERDLKNEGVDTSNLVKLQRLLQSLGSMFFLILISNASERRVFSIALSSEPEEELKEVLNYGVKLGYFQESTIGNKSGTGRTRLYILNRRLAPVFTLDPTSFAGYKFISAEELMLALKDPDQFIRKVRDKLLSNPDEDIAINSQLELFE